MPPRADEALESVLNAMAQRSETMPALRPYVQAGRAHEAREAHQRAHRARFESESELPIVIAEELRAFGTDVDRVQHLAAQWSEPAMTDHTDWSPTHARAGKDEASKP